MFGSYLNDVQQTEVGLALVLGAISMVLQGRGKDKSALWVLLGAALVLRLFFALLDPYLNQWDESWHAVAAKSMLTDPLVPRLFREEALPLPTDNWTLGHVWLHKQPFFLWLMALSMKLFGVSVFSVRLPSVLFSTALVFFTHGIGQALHGRWVAYLAALLTTYASWSLEMVAGFTATDHNDLVFSVLIGGSLWAYYTYRDLPGRRLILLVGAFVGCAILTKWLTGLLVFAGWGLVAAFHASSKANEFRRLFKAFGLALLISMPVQLYWWLRFPLEWTTQMEHNAAHITTALDNHVGTSGFYFDLMPEMFHPFGSYMLCIMTALACLLVKDRSLRLHATVSVSVLIAFFTLASTKMPGFILPVFPYFFIGIAYWIDRTCSAAEHATTATWFRLSITGYLAVSMINFERVQVRHSPMCVKDRYFGEYRPARLHNAQSLAELAALLDAFGRSIAFNVPVPEHLGLSFHYGHEAVHWLPGAAEAESLRKAGVEVVVVDPPEGALTDLPPHVRLVHLAHPFLHVP